MNASPLKVISSMATRQLLADLVAAWRRQGGSEVRVESVGGVDAARRVQAGEGFDAVCLAANAIDTLAAAGRVVAGSRVDIVRSGVAVAVRAGAARPDIASESALKAAVLGARSLSYSTGPSGVALQKLFERWGIAAEIAGRIVQAPPGVPVGTLVARGEVELGFQQLSELMNLEGITVIGPLPPEIQIVTTFSGAVASSSQQPEAVRAWLAFLASPGVEPVKQANGMDAA
ncbi:MAG: substrate-binding domain-containing protein [Burkholderiales bacterium]|nr:substrate-binding domain-containing protein [Burkholderiales bacterium]MDE2398282.1 substrate-binding domain-containing protein [Burkholderiales bacterium]MDE2454857.1 substrate-binding domain-containing protein [Burkholderiales bacterium]